MEQARTATIVTAMYRRFLQLAARLPQAERARVGAQVRAAFRAAAPERDPAAVAALLATARDRLAYLRVIAPRHAGEGGGGEGAGGGATAPAPPRATFTVRDGVVVRADAAADGARAGRAPHSSFAAGAPLDAALVRRHAASLERFRFGGRA